MSNIGLATAPITVKAAGTESVSTTSGGVSLGYAPRGTYVLITIAVTAITGTLLLAFDGSNNGNNWQEFAMFGADGVRTFTLGVQPTPFSAPATVSQLVSLSPILRYRSVITGSATYSVTSSFVINPDGA